MYPSSIAVPVCHGDVTATRELPITGTVFVGQCRPRGGRQHRRKTATRTLLLTARGAIFTPLTIEEATKRIDAAQAGL